jgi:uncharacterized membrane protein
VKLKIVAYPSSLPHELLVKLFCQTFFPKQLSFTKKLLVKLFFNNNNNNNNKKKKKKKNFTNEAELCQTSPKYAL